MATLKKELRDILERYGIDARDKDKVWDCHGTLVLYHKAYEIIAAQEKISFDPPIVLEANGAAKSVALCVVAQMGDRIEWSTGEAAPGNNKNAYPYAMAEKRAKDRVVGKLVGLAAYVLSEDESDDFKTGERKAVDDDGSPPANPPANSPKAHTAPQTEGGKPLPNEKSIRAVTDAHTGRFELLFPNGELLHKFDTPEAWCEGLRDAIKMPNAEVIGLWETNLPLAESIAERFPNIKWDVKGNGYHPIGVIESLVRKLTPGMAA